MKILEILRESPEARIEFLAKTMGEKLAAAAKKDHSISSSDPVRIVKTLANFDPSPNKKALSFVAKMYANGAIRAEDSTKIKDTLRLFFKVSDKLKNRDLMSYKSLGELYRALAPFKDVGDETLSGRAHKKIVKADAEKLIDTPEFKVIIPKTEEASKYYGAGTQWCTAGDKDNRFNAYNKLGPLYVIIAGRGNNQRKFQLHYEHKQFMDEQDENVSSKDIQFLSSFPEYKQFLEYLIDKHHSKYFNDPV